MCTKCDWEEFSADIREMLDDARYAFAEDTLTGILDWVEEAEHCTDRQRDAVENIRNSVRN